MVGDMAGRVAWSVDDDDFQRAKSEHLVVHNAGVGFDWWDYKWQAEEASLQVRVLSFVSVQFMQKHLCRWEALGHSTVVGKVVEMPVG